MGTILEIVNKITPIVQNKASETGENLDYLIQEELKKECLGVVQNNQSTLKNIHDNYNTGGSENEN